MTHESMTCEEMLKEANHILANAKRLEKTSSTQEAANAWKKARDMYEKVRGKTKPTEQIGRSARIGVVKATFKLEGVEKTTELLVSMIKAGDIPPRTIEELKTYLGIKEIKF